MRRTKLARRNRNEVERRDDGSIVVHLNHGRIAVIDAFDYLRIHDASWHASRDGNCLYASASVFVGGQWRTVRMHDLIMDRRSDEVIDHINGDGLDNRRCNLRRCSNGRNIQNSRRRRDNTSGVKGVRWHEGKWQARISVNGKRLSLGHFVDIRDAAAAYAQGARKYYGDFARL